MPEFKIESEALQLVLAKSIVDALSQDERTEIITQAVKYLTGPTMKNDRYGNNPTPTGPSPLQTAFNHAVMGIASTVAHEVLAARPEFKAEITKIAGEVLVQFMEQRGSDFAETMTKGIQSGVTSYLEALRSY